MFFKKMKLNSVFLSYPECKIWVKKNLSAKKLKTVSDWKRIADDLPDFIPQNPKLYYRKVWINWGDFLGLDSNGKFLNYTDAKNWVHDNINLYEINTKDKWINNNFELPDFIPKAPHNFYKFTGWIGWSDWLNTDNEIE